MFRRLTAVALTLMSLRVAAQQTESVDLRTCIPSIEMQPYYYSDPTKAGRAEQLMRNAAENLRLSIRVEHLPLLRCQRMLNRTELDFMLLAPTPGNMELACFPMKDGQIDTTLSLGHPAFVFVKRRDSNWNWDGRQIDGDRNPVIGVRNGARGLVKSLREKGYQIDDTTLTPHQALLKVVTRRNDLTLLPEEYAKLELLLPEFKQLEILPIEFNGLEFYYAARCDLNSTQTKKINLLRREAVKINTTSK